MIGGQMFYQEDYPFLYVPGFIENTSLVWERILWMGKKYDFNKGEYVSTRNEKNSIWYIKEGLITFIPEIMTSENEEILYLLSKGCLARDGINSTTYNLTHLIRCKALSDVSIYEFEKSILYNKEFVLYYPDLIKNYAETLSLKFISHIILFSIRKLRSTNQKVAYFIYGFYLLRGKKSSFIPPLSQSLLGKLLGLSTYTINRAVKELKRRNLLTIYTKTKIDICNVPGLKELAYNC